MIETYIRVLEDMRAWEESDIKIEALNAAIEALTEKLDNDKTSNLGA